VSTANPLSGDAAALIIRALLDFRSLWTTHDLVSTSGVPAPTCRRVVTLLEREALVERQAPGVIAVPNWLRLLRRWTEDTNTRRATHWRSRHRSTHVLDRVATTQVRHAVTGVQAARHWVQEAPAGPTVIYTPDIHRAAADWDLAPTMGRSVVLVESKADLVYTRTRKTDSGLRLAAPSQVLSDLLTGAAKSTAGADSLTHWMLEHELDWRY
jgi:hypothetical protein